ncbi:hypothetical protein V6N11_004798 [Hibiscus sabdariffa]|uniref:RNase H type-1 domain-containing protein n=1 Tax=Hibiscus sabdariffa TaxID=183260 RepID=A0ABR2SHC9_9ROSI
MVLPSESIERIATVPPLRDDTGSDRSMWRWDVKHRFTTRSAYDFLSHEEELEDPAIWQCIWKMSDWLCKNLFDQSFMGEDVDWPTRFPVLCWLLWKRRCSLLLDSEANYMDDILTRGNRLVEECSRAVSTVPQTTLRYVDQSRWTAPPQGCIKLNVNAVVSPTSHKAGIGGVFRDAHGRWILGFTRFVGALSHNSLVSSIKEMLVREWRVVVQHVSRASNKVADKLAARGRELGSKQTYFSSPPADVMDVVEEESMEIGSAVSELTGIR